RPPRPPVLARLASGGGASPSALPDAAAPVGNRRTASRRPAGRGARRAGAGPGSAFLAGLVARGDGHAAGDFGSAGRPDHAAAVRVGRPASDARAAPANAALAGRGAARGGLVPRHSPIAWTSAGQASTAGTARRAAGGFRAASGAGPRGIHSRSRGRLPDRQRRSGADATG